MGVEGGEVVVLSRDTGGNSRAGMEYFSIDPLRGIYTTLDHGNFTVEGVANVGAGLGTTPLIKVGDRVVVGVGNIVLCPITLEDAVGVFFIVITFQGIFYCRNMIE